jgi:hypothetical protein
VRSRRGDADGAAWGIEGNHGGRGAGATPVGVEAAAIDGIACASGAHGLEGFGHFIGDSTGGTAQRELEEAGGSEGVVANHLGGQAEMRGPRASHWFSGSSAMVLASAMLRWR